MPDMKTLARPCHYCDRLGVYLCDHVTGPRGQSCDRPLCELHRVKAGAYIACRRGKGGGPTRGSIDYCPEHAGLHGVGITVTQARYRINSDDRAAGGKSLTCLTCHHTSYLPMDVEHRYCGYCKRFLDDPLPNT